MTSHHQSGQQIASMRITLNKKRNNFRVFNFSNSLTIDCKCKVFGLSCFHSPSSVSPFMVEEL